MDQQTARFFIHGKILVDKEGVILCRGLLEEGEGHFALDKSTLFINHDAFTDNPLFIDKAPGLRSGAVEILAQKGYNLRLIMRNKLFLDKRHTNLF